MSRLTMPLQFRSEAQALELIRANSLFTLGAKPVKVEVTTDESDFAPWRIVIEARNPTGVLRYLNQNHPGVEWTVSA
jgi:hypothetical protein